MSFSYVMPLPFAGLVSKSARLASSMAVNW